MVGNISAHFEISYHLIMTHYADFVIFRDIRSLIR